MFVGYKKLGNKSAPMMLAKTGVRTEYATLNCFDPAYFQTLTSFLDRMIGFRRAP
jgi:hypothetical protein